MQIQLFKDTEIWVIALKSLCFCQKDWNLVNGLSKNEDVLEKQKYYWQRFNAFIGDEKEDIIAEASIVTKKKVQKFHTHTVGCVMINVNVDGFFHINLCYMCISVHTYMYPNILSFVMKTVNFSY